MLSEELREATDLSAAAWIAPRLGGAFGAVTRTVPGGYPAYARICHPVGSATWAQVAAQTGRSAHPTMQWHALVRGSQWRGEEPRQGHLLPHALTILCDVLAEHTSTGASCWFCLWEGYSWIQGAQSDQLVSHPGRNYLLFSGRLSAAHSMGWWPRPDFFEAQSPNLFWPEDRAWCVASEIDFDSTLIGGDQALIDAILQVPDLDAWPVRPEDSLAADADHINVTQY